MVGRHGEVTLVDETASPAGSGQPLGYSFAASSASNSLIDFWANPLSGFWARAFLKLARAASGWPSSRQAWP
jgi:hypothetical protein